MKRPAWRRRDSGEPRAAGSCRPRATPVSVGLPVRRALVVVLALVLFLVGASTADAQWPTTCVELNDIAEAAAGRPHNVGIYQRSVSPPSLEAAEAACQHDHSADVQGAFAWALGGSGSAVDGVWPTTCVELNDLAEAARGDPRNVGIYQRVYGWNAETRCQTDHIQDVRATFAWAIPSQPPPAPQPQPHAHPDYERVRVVALARSGNPAQAVSITVDVIGRGTVDAFLRGHDDGVAYGRWACDWQSVACPLAPERVVCLHMDRDPNFVRSPQCPYVGIDEGLVEAYKLIKALDVPALIAPFGLDHWQSWWQIDRTWIRWAPQSEMHSPQTYAEYDGYRNVRVSTDYRYLSTESLASILAHELSHVATPGRPSCIHTELLATVTEAIVWAELGHPDLEGRYGRSINGTARAIDAQVQRAGWWGNADNDLREWSIVVDQILYDRGYDESCA